MTLENLKKRYKRRNKSKLITRRKTWLKHTSTEKYEIESLKEVEEKEEGGAEKE
jgi:hypothetical protein